MGEVDADADASAEGELTAAGTVADIEVVNGAACPSYVIKLIPADMFRASPSGIARILLTSANVGPVTVGGVGVVATLLCAGVALLCVVVEDA